MTVASECFVSVDIETAGPVPGMYSMLTIGACLVEDDSVTFQCAVKPITERADPEALKVSGLSLAELQRDGMEPSIAMQRFAEWTAHVANGRTPVFVGLNAAFDWSFINYYFHVYTGANPFGFAPLDLKALYMGVTGSAWHNAKSSQMKQLLRPSLIADHDALNDARAQAELFRLTLQRQREH